MLTSRGRFVTRMVAATALVGAAAATLYVVESRDPVDGTADTPAAAASTAPGPATPPSSASPGPDGDEAPTPDPSPTPDPAELEAARQQRAETAADDALATMTTEEKIGQLLVLPVYGSTIDESATGNRRLHGTDTARQALERWRPGGVILFREQPYGDTHNLDDPAQIRRLTDQLHTATELPVLVAVDQEHGVVERLPASATLLPSLMAVASGGPATAREAAELTAAELAAVGIDVNFAPVADVQTNPDNPVIGVRAAGSDPETVAATVVAQLEGYADSPVAPTVKHFPGHGDTDVDSHRGLPRIGHDRQRLEAVELAPFRAAVAAGVPLVMTGHLQVPALDPSGTPATLSASIISEVLRGDLGFAGVVVSDSLQMNAVRGIAPDGELAVRAVEAGVDLLLMPTDTAAAVAGLEAAVASGRISGERLDASVHRILLLKGLLGRLPGTAPPDTTAALRHDVGTPAARATAVELAEAGLTHVRGRCFDAPDAPVVVVADEESPAGGAMVAELTALGHDARLVGAGRRPGSADRQAAVRAAAPAGLTVVWADPKADAWQLLAAQVDAANTVLTVLTDLPTDGASTAGDGVLAAYGDAAVQGTALARLLVTGGAPSGRLAVDVPGAGTAGDRISCDPGP